MIVPDSPEEDAILAGFVRRLLTHDKARCWGAHDFHFYGALANPKDYGVAFDIEDQLDITVEEYEVLRRLVGEDAR